MSKKFVKSIVSMALSLGMVWSLAACGGAASSSGSQASGTPNASQGGEGQTTVTFALWDEVQLPVFEGICEEFTKQNPDIKVELQLTPWDQYWTKLDAAAGSGKAADVFWMNIFMPKYADAGIIEPLDSYFEKDGVDKSQWSSSMMEMYNYQGAQYGMPKGMDVVVVAYNKAIFDKYGVEYPKEGWTWKDMEATGVQLRDNIAAQGGSEYPMLMELDSQPSYLQFMMQDGVKLYSEDGLHAGYNTPEAQKAFDDILGLMDQKILPDFTVLSDTKGTDLFLSERGAMLYVGSWKSVVLDDASFASQIGLVPMPSRSVDNVCALGGISYAMNANSENKEAAWKLIQFLGGEESNKIQAEARIDIPAFLSAQEYYAPAFHNIDPTAFITQSKTSMPYPVHPKMAEWFGIETDYVTAIFSRETTVPEGLDGLNTEIEAIMAG